MARSVLSMAKDVLRRSAMNKLDRQLKARHAMLVTPEQKRWVENHRAKHDAEQEATSVRYMKEELEYLGNG